jgi:capsular exopolysaccharide synthesis family protein
MSKFLQALEQAEQDQALRQQAAPREPMIEEASTVHARVVEAPLPSAAEFAPQASEDLDEHLVSLLAPSSFEAEQYRALRHLIEQRNKSADLSVIAVSSPGAADGKTTTAINLAGALAQAPAARVLLVDGDLRGAALATRLGLGHLAGPGLVDAILDPTLSLLDVVHSRPHLNLSVLTAGQLPSAPYEVLKSARFGELLAEARRRFDYIVLDTPPLVSVPDCRVIGKWVDGFLIVVTAHRTSRKLLEEALKVTEPAKIVGLVFNGDDRHLSRHTYPSRRSSARSDRRHSASDD